MGIFGSGNFTRELSEREASRSALPLRVADLQRRPEDCRDCDVCTCSAGAPLDIAPVPAAPACDCGRDAQGGPYPRVHGARCAYVQPRVLAPGGLPVSPYQSNMRTAVHPGCVQSFEKWRDQSAAEVACDLAPVLDGIEVVEMSPEDLAFAESLLGMIQALAIKQARRRLIEVRALRRDAASELVELLRQESALDDFLNAASAPVRL